MKFTKFGALALASLMAFSSCSKEEVMSSGAEDLLPGEARISFTVGKKGATTYSTEANEKAMKNGGLKLFSTTDGAEIQMTGVTFTNGTFTATVPAANFTPGQQVKLFAHVNAETIIESGNGTAQAKHEGARVTTALDLNLTKGAPAANSFMFELKSGVNSLTFPALKRAIARLGVKSGNAMSIKGFKVTSSNVNLTAGGGLYTPTTPAVAGTQSFTATVAGDGIGEVAGNTGLTETLGYMYPSSEVTLTVEAPDGKSIPAKFTPAANTNYALKITQAPSVDGSINFTVAIDAWAEGGDIDADFNTPTLPTIGFVTDIIDVSAFPGASASQNDIMLNEFGSFPAAKALSLADLAIGTNQDAAAATSLDKIEVKASSNPKVLQVTADLAKRELMIRQAPNKTGAPVSVDITIEATDENGVKGVGTITVLVPSIAQESITAMEEATVEMDGKNWVMFGMDPNLKTTYDRALAIKKAGGFTTENLSILANRKTLFMPGTYGSNSQCPIGYRLPTLDEFFSLTAERTGQNATAEGKWTPVVGDKKTFAKNNRILHHVANAGTGNDALSYYTLTDPTGAVMHIVGNAGYVTSTTVGRWGETGNLKYTIAPWSGGIDVSSVGPGLSPVVVLRCVEDASADLN